jgi:hypothetical protein
LRYPSHVRRAGSDRSRYEAGQEIKARKKAYPQMSQMNADEQEMKKSLFLPSHLRSSATSADKYLS